MRQLVHRRLEREHRRASRRARASRTASGTSSATSRCVVRRFGAAYMHAAWRPPSARRTRAASRSARPTSWAMRRASPSGVGAEPDALDRRRPVADEREHLLAGQGELDRPPDDPGAPARPATACGRGMPFDPNPPPTCWRDDPDPLGVEAEHLGERCPRAERRPASSRRGSAARRPTSATRGVRLHRVVVLDRASCRSRRPRRRPRPARRRRRRPRCRSGTPG